MGVKVRMRTGFVLALLFCFASIQGTQAAETGLKPGEPRRGWDFSDAAMIPVQSGGRIKPLDTFAREIMLFQTGSRYFQGWDPVDLLLSFMTAPEAWENRPFVRVGREDLRRQIGLDEKRIQFTPKELFDDSHLAEYASRLGNNQRPMSPPPGGEPKKDQREEELRRTVERLTLFRRIVSGESWPVIPQPNPAPWKTLAEGDPMADSIRQSFAKMAIAHQKGEREAFERHAREVRETVGQFVQDPPPGFATALRVELTYNRLHPFLWAWILYLSAAAIWIFAIALNQRGVRAGRWLTGGAWTLTLTGIAMHVGGFGMRAYVAGRPPVTNMYESIIWVSFGVMVFALILYALRRQAILIPIACALCTLGMVAADSAPAMMDPGIHPLVPVLRSNYWLTIHVLTITISYSAFALCLGLGNLALWQYLRQTPGWMARAQNLNDLSYRSMQYGVVLLAAGTILGGVWADYSWGRFWGWDPKEVWALIALLIYLVILHGRMTSWIGQFGFAVWTVLAFMGVVMAWYGVNFVLGVGLHSYGFASGGRGWVASFVGLQALYCLAATVIFKMKAASRTRVPAPAQG